MAHFAWDATRNPNKCPLFVILRLHAGARPTTTKEEDDQSLGSAPKPGPVRAAPQGWRTGAGSTWTEAEEKGASATPADRRATPSVPLHRRGEERQPDLTLRKVVVGGGDGSGSCAAALTRGGACPWRRTRGGGEGGSLGTHLSGSCSSVASHGEDEDGGAGGTRWKKRRSSKLDRMLFRVFFWVRYWNR